MEPNEGCWVSLVSVCLSIRWECWAWQLYGIHGSFCRNWSSQDLMFAVVLCQLPLCPLPFMACTPSKGRCCRPL